MEIDTIQEPSNVQKCFLARETLHGIGRPKEYIYNDTKAKFTWKLIFNKEGEPWFYELLESKYVGGGIQYLNSLKHTYMLR